MAGSKQEDIECGFSRVEDHEIIDKLPTEEVKRLAAMAVRFFDSKWSDRARDIYLGVKDVLEREPADDEEEDDADEEGI